ncbi:DUF2089 domain-containing protein [Luteococcus sp. Sow4_B9]|uniref:DUF2089 domain-containing protein n=1 Tax=Luteococcus sp. Sow4_B9 TaxID=3438792 RepID=UPI003F984279
MSNHNHPVHRAPAHCPVCTADLVTTRLGCDECGTELGGRFERCRFCSLEPEQLELLTVFLASRGNLREVAKHQQVSYPTARGRLSALLASLGIDEMTTVPEAEQDQDAESRGPTPRTRDEVLAEVAAGRISPSEAAALLRG